MELRRYFFSRTRKQSEEGRALIESRSSRGYNTPEPRQGYELGIIDRRRTSSPQGTKILSDYCKWATHLFVMYIRRPSASAGTSVCIMTWEQTQQITGAYVEGDIERERCPLERFVRL